MDKDLKLKLRPFYLAQILYERTDEDHSLSTAELMEVLENEYGIKTHRQRIPADVEVLRSFGMEIQEIMSSQKRYNLISREYDIAEIKLLIDAVESSKFITKKKSEELVAKLSKMAGRNQAENLRRNIAAEDRIKYDNESIYLIIDGINEAINKAITGVTSGLTVIDSPVDKQFVTAVSEEDGIITVSRSYPQENTIFRTTNPIASNRCLRISEGLFAGQWLTFVYTIDGVEDGYSLKI